MAIYDLTTPLSAGNSVGFLPNRVNQLWEGPPTRVRRRIVTIGSPDWTNSVTGVYTTPAPGDVARTNPIDLGALVTAVWLNVLNTSSVASSIAYLGDSAAYNTFTTVGIPLTATTSNMITTGTPKWYSTAADYLLLTLGNTAATAGTGAVVDTGFVAISVIPYASIE